MIATDLFATFEEVGFDNEEKIKALGRRSVFNTLVLTLQNRIIIYLFAVGC